MHLYIPKIGSQTGVELLRLRLEIQDAGRALNGALIEYIETMQRYQLLAKSEGQHIKINRQGSQSLPYYRQYEKKHGPVGKKW